MSSKKIDILKIVNLTTGDKPQQIVKLKMVYYHGYSTPRQKSRLQMDSSLRCFQLLSQQT
ncbi:hypothetical protein PFTANZ_02016 [Plasmodium falciparum Tanzania (2000708)]|uniref:Uncharacterized protein n=2 Tax=Plasmodium falciparum TaxID=5833 RepID=A0A024W9N2_PLAFA|nr:hypothetical protein PFTANZ_02016 [Plasmodium falciparum Tanzania (2000708)]ETW43515.1 hypothetical protein PFNF135_02052 [Plasmodium falciparum NF135/5.C10]